MSVGRATLRATRPTRHPSARALSSHKRTSPQILMLHGLAQGRKQFAQKIAFIRDESYRASKAASTSKVRDIRSTFVDAYT